MSEQDNSTMSNESEVIVKQNSEDENKSKKKKKTKTEEEITVKEEPKIEETIEDKPKKKKKTKTEDTLESQPIKQEIKNTEELVEDKPKRKKKTKTEDSENVSESQSSEITVKQEDKPIVEDKPKRKKKTEESKQETVEEDKPKKRSRSKERKEDTFVLESLNLTNLDRQYVLSELINKQGKKSEEDEHTNDMKSITTSLEQLGISNAKKEPFKNIYWGEHYKIQLFLNDSQTFLHDINNNYKCSWCRQLPPKGSLMLAVPFNYVANYIQQQVYAPENVNVVPISDSNTPLQVNFSKEKNKKVDLKNTPKINSFKKSMNIGDNITDREIIKRDYFECSKFVCSFACMMSKGKELSNKDYKFKNYKSVISHLYYRIFEELPEYLAEAPSPDVLIEYGGVFTLEEYRKDFIFIKINETNQYYHNAKSILNIKSDVLVVT